MSLIERSGEKKRKEKEKKEKKTRTTHSLGCSRVQRFTTAEAQQQQQRLLYCCWYAPPGSQLLFTRQIWTSSSSVFSLKCFLALPNFFSFLSMLSTEICYLEGICQAENRSPCDYLQQIMRWSLQVQSCTLRITLPYGSDFGRNNNYFHRESLNNLRSSPNRITFV